MKLLTGIQPSGELHIGNYFGAIKPIVEAQKTHDVYTFIANYHAMTTVRDGRLLPGFTMQAAIDFLALGLEPQNTTFWVQSDVSEVLELYWVLSSFTTMGLLERAHSYKDKVARGIKAGHSLFSYPVLMAADILLYGVDGVLVGKDQIQHVEIARDIAARFNHTCGDVFKLPEAKVDDQIATVPGTDGQKMSKSYGNTINIFADEKQLRTRIQKIVTASVPQEALKEYERCNVYNLASLFLNEKECTALQERYLAGKEGFGSLKADLFELMWEYFRPHRQRRLFYAARPDDVRAILHAGAEKARKIARPRLNAIASLTGTEY